MLFLSPLRLVAPGISPLCLALLLFPFSQMAAAQASRMAPPPRFSTLRVALRLLPAWRRPSMPSPPPR